MNTINDFIKSPTYWNKKILIKILEKVLNTSKIDITTHPERKISTKNSKKIQQLYKQYKTHNKPLAYILWKEEFYWLDFKVNENTLIPRGETENIVELASQKLNKNKNWIIFDIGTGCWAIATTLSYLFSEKIKYSFLTDIDIKTLNTAKKNFLNINPNKKAYFKKSSLINFFDNLDDFTDDLQNKDILKIITANLPYISEEDFNDYTDMWVKKREPTIALKWWNNWLYFYNLLLEEISYYTKKFNIKNLQTFLEVTNSQSKTLQKEYKSLFQFEEENTFHTNIKILICKKL